MSDWRSDLLGRLGHQPTATRLKALDLWARSEGVRTSFHNPLGAADFNEFRQEWDVRDELHVYGSINAAVADYARLFRSQAFGRLGIAFGLSLSLAGLWEAIHLSGWREQSYQTGHYPVLLYRVAITPTLTGKSPDKPLSVLAHDIGASWHRLSRELHVHSAQQVARARTFSKRMHSAVR